MGYSELEIDTINSRISLVELIGEYVELKRSGSSGFMGACPFHDEKTPSFHVNPNIGIFKCFGCGEAGNAFTFLMKYLNWTFPEAVNHLAERTGVELTGNQRRRNLKNHYTALEEACMFYELSLRGNQEAQFYLMDRGMDERTIQRFRLGFSPREGDKLKRSLLARGYNERLLIEAGLIRRSKKENQTYDFFRGRLMFPIMDHSGKVVAFSGRDISEDPKIKYINSPESEVFQKKWILYGFNLAARRIRETKEIILFEGYTDVTSSNQNNLENVVCAMGTSLTPEQVRTLVNRYPEDYKLIFCFDSDRAGKKAAMRAVELLEGKPSSICILPEGRDPAEIWESGEDLREYLDDSVPAFDFYVQQKARGLNLNDLNQQMSFLTIMRPYLVKLPFEKKELFISNLEKQTGIKESVIRNYCYGEEDLRRLIDVHQESLETSLIRQITKWPDLARRFKDLIDPSTFITPEPIQILNYLSSLNKNEKEIFSSRLFQGETLERVLEGMKDLENGIIPNRRRIASCLNSSAEPNLNYRQLQNIYGKILALSFLREVIEQSQSNGVQEIINLISKARGELIG